MNYIKEINAFYDTIERNPLSASAVTLWHALMHINNKAYWCLSFTVAASVLKFKTGLTDSSFKRARKELSQKGFITYQSRPGNQAPIYHMISLTHETDRTTACTETTQATHTNTVSQPGSPKTPNTNSNQNPHTDLYADTSTVQSANHITNDTTDHRKDHNTNPLIKQNKTTENQTKTNHHNQGPTNPITFYKTNFDTPSSFIYKSIINWTHDTSEELIIHAMERALEQGKAHWGYVKGILKNWKQNDIRHLSEVQSDTIHNQNRSLYPTNTPEIIPDWFKALEQQKTAQPKTNPTSEYDEAAIIAETQALIESIT